MKTVLKSSKLNNVLYDVRGPIVDAARQMEDEGQKIIKLNIGNMAPFGFDPPEEVVQDMARNLPDSAGYSDSKGIFAARKAVMHYTQQQGIAGVTLDDIYLGNGASELIVMATQALLNDGDEVLARRLDADDERLDRVGLALAGSVIQMVEQLGRRHDLPSRHGARDRLRVEVVLQHVLGAANEGRVECRRREVSQLLERLHEVHRVRQLDHRG